MIIMGKLLLGVRRCPHCSIATPTLTRVWASQHGTERNDGGDSKAWGAYVCGNCGAIVTAQAYSYNQGNEAEAIFPESKKAHVDLPEVAKVFLQQAFDTLSAPDAAVVMAGAAVDAMLKAKDYIEGSLYTRIDAALTDNVLTQGMATWAHSVRLEANSVRHADIGKPHATPDEAKQSVEFAEALGSFLFVLTAKIERGIEAAKSAEAET